MYCVGRHFSPSKVVPDVSGFGFRGVGGAVQLPYAFDGVVADDNDSEDFTREHEFDSSLVKGFADMVLVVFFDEFAVGRYRLVRTDRKASPSVPLFDFVSVLVGVGFDEDEGPLVVGCHVRAPSDGLALEVLAVYEAVDSCNLLLRSWLGPECLFLAESCVSRTPGTTSAMTSRRKR